MGRCMMDIAVSPLGLGLVYKSCSVNASLATRFVLLDTTEPDFKPSVSDT
jgi:hypothetical protein